MARARALTFSWGGEGMINLGYDPAGCYCDGQCTADIPALPAACCLLSAFLSL